MPSLPAFYSPPNRPPNKSNVDVLIAFGCPASLAAAVDALNTTADNANTAAIVAAAHVAEQSSKIALLTTQLARAMQVQAPSIPPYALAAELFSMQAPGNTLLSTISTAATAALATAQAAISTYAAGAGASVPAGCFFG